MIFFARHLKYRQHKHNEHVVRKNTIDFVQLSLKFPHNVVARFLRIAQKHLKHLQIFRNAFSIGQILSDGGEGTARDQKTHNKPHPTNQLQSLTFDPQCWPTQDAFIYLFQSPTHHHHNATNNRPKHTVSSG
jgi:hypothetical protein